MKVKIFCIMIVQHSWLGYKRYALMEKIVNSLKSSENQQNNLWNQNMFYKPGMKFVSQELEEVASEVLGLLDLYRNCPRQK